MTQGRLISISQVTSSSFASDFGLNQIPDNPAATLNHWQCQWNRPGSDCTPARPILFGAAGSAHVNPSIQTCHPRAMCCHPQESHQAGLAEFLMHATYMGMCSICSSTIPDSSFNALRCGQQTRYIPGTVRKQTRDGSFRSAEHTWCSKMFHQVCHSSNKTSLDVAGAPILANTHHMPDLEGLGTGQSCLSGQAQGSVKRVTALQVHSAGGGYIA